VLKDRVLCQQWADISACMLFLLALSQIFDRVLELAALLHDCLHLLVRNRRSLSYLLNSVSLQKKILLWII